MTEMSAAEFRTIREGLGLTRDWLATELNVSERSVARWEAGSHRVPEGVADQLSLLAATAAVQVDDHVEALTGAKLPPVIVIEEGPGAWPKGWQRAVAFRVRELVPGLRIMDREPDD